MRIIITKRTAGPDGAFAVGGIYDVPDDVGKRLVAEFAAEPYAEVEKEYAAAAVVVEAADARPLARLGRLLRPLQ